MIKFTEEEIRAFTKQADSKSTLARLLKISDTSVNGNAIKTINKLIVELNLDISHFDKGRSKHREKYLLYPYVKKQCPVCNKEFETQSGDRDEKYVCSRGCANTYYRSGKNHPNYKENSTEYRKRALANLENKCSNPDCEITKAGIEIVVNMLDVDHINSDRSDNSLENLQILCVWCHAKKTRKL